MGRTYKRDPNQDTFDDLALIDDTDDDTDTLDWMARPNEARPTSAGRRGGRAYRGLPDDWRDFDDDVTDALWR